jgi:8-amino-7-oxononanoate synthase
MDEAAASPLQAQLHLLLDRRKQQSRLRSLKASPAASVDLSSNDFLSLSTSLSLKSEFLNEVSRIPRLGSTGSRLLDGNSAYAENLEREIADFHNAPAGLLVNSGFDANVGMFSCLPQPGDVVVYDELIHASVHDGIKASRAARNLAFAHNSVSDLKIVLEEVMWKSSGRQPFNVFIAVESVYSMDGDLSPLKEIVELVEACFPNKNAHLIVDEAHATGLYGEKGKGRVCELGLEHKVFVRLHTFGKALACNGGEHVLRREVCLANTSSHNPMHTAHTPIPDQLCPTTNLHHFHVISSTCWNQSSVQCDGRGPDRRIGQRIGHTHCSTVLELAETKRPVRGV